MPLDRLRVKRPAPGRARASSVEDLETVSVTPDGKVERRKLSPELRARLQRKLNKDLRVWLARTASAAPSARSAGSGW